MPNDIDTEKQEQDLFLEISKAIREDDHAALDRLVVPDEVVPEKVVPVEEEVKEEVVVENKTVTEETKDDTVVKEEVVEEVVEDDPATTIAKLQEELEQQRVLNHKLKSDAGRVPSLQRKLAEVDNKLREMAQKPNPSAAATREDKRVLSEKLAQIKEHDPLLADAVMELVNDAISGLRQEIEPKVTAVERATFDKELEETLDNEMTKLKEVVPNAIEVFQSPAWKEWKAELPANWLALAESMYADDVITALQRYSRDMYARHPELVKAPAQVAATTTTTTATPTEESERVKQQRQQKLTTKTPGTASVSAKDSPSIDEEALFAKVFKEETAKFKR
jgi:hypothetical protein